MNADAGMLDNAAQRARRLEGRRLYLCTPDRDDLAHFVDSCISGGVDVVQLRDKHLDARPLLERCALVRAVCADRGVPFIVNDRPDLALEADADGVHVGQDDAPASLARRILGPEKIVGLSTHAPPELEGALGEPVDYVSAGPVIETPTKPGRPGTGSEYVRAAALACASVPGRDRPLPFYVTGGVTPERIGPLFALGARHVVVVRYLTESARPEAAARRLSDAIAAALHA